MMVDRWKHRRAMAWIAFIVGCLYPFVALLGTSTELTSMATSFYMFISAVVGAYIGFATLDDKWQEKGKEAE